jgi:hypothetical protein
MIIQEKIVVDSNSQKNLKGQRTQKKTIWVTILPFTFQNPRDYKSARVRNNITKLIKI